MILLLLLLRIFSLVFFVAGGCFCEENTVSSYDIQVGPNSDPIRIIEGEDPWHSDGSSSSFIRDTATSRPISRGAIYTTSRATTNINSPLTEDHDEGQENFSHSALQDFLNSYAEKLKKDKLKPTEEDINNAPSDDNEDDENDKEKKSWNLMNIRKHKHPYEDKDGWVSLDPIPWSVSKISKWQNKIKPTEKPSWHHKYHNSYAPTPSSNMRPWSNYDTAHDVGSSYQYSTSKPLYDKKKYQVYYVNAPSPPAVKPTYPKPSSSIYIQTSPSYQPTHSYYKHEEPCNNHHDEHGYDDGVGGTGIITDGLPPNFPPRIVDVNRRQGTEMLHDRHPYMSDGEWVLLSTTKGYKAAKSKQRSLNVHPEAIGTHRSVRLTVLPPLKGSKVNMTTSHGGLLQVESTFESVEQAQRKFQKNRNKLKRPTKFMKKKIRRPITDSTIAITHNTGTDSGAVLAGVGAGMIPATMAMLVPMAMQGRRRRKREILTTGYPTLVDITLPRYHY